MKSQPTSFPKQETDSFRLPSERLVHRFPCAAPIAALEAMSATTKLLIHSHYPSMQELMDTIEEGQQPGKSLPSAGAVPSVHQEVLGFLLSGDGVGGSHSQGEAHDVTQSLPYRHQMGFFQQGYLEHCTNEKEGESRDDAPPTFRKPPGQGDPQAKDGYLYPVPCGEILGGASHG